MREAAAMFNIATHSTIQKWKKSFDLRGVDGLKQTQNGRPPMKKEINKLQLAEVSEKALQAEIERLRMENAYLKKLNALVQNKEKSPNKTKHK